MGSKNDRAPCQSDFCDQELKPEMEGETPVPELQVQLAIRGGEFLEFDLMQCIDLFLLPPLHSI